MYERYRVNPKMTRTPAARKRGVSETRLRWSETVSEQTVWEASEGDNIKINCTFREKYPCPCHLGINGEIPGGIHDECPGDAKYEAKLQKIDPIERIHTRDVVLPVHHSFSKRGCPLLQVYPAGCYRCLPIPWYCIVLAVGILSWSAFVAPVSVEEYMLFWEF